MAEKRDPKLTETQYLRRRQAFLRAAAQARTAPPPQDFLGLDHEMREQALRAPPPEHAFEPQFEPQVFEPHAYAPPPSPYAPTPPTAYTPMPPRTVAPPTHAHAPTAYTPMPTRTYAPQAPHAPPPPSPYAPTPPTAYTPMPPRTVAPPTHAYAPTAPTAYTPMPTSTYAPPPAHAQPPPRSYPPPPTAHAPISALMQPAPPGEHAYAPPPAHANPNSWLLGLDDARAGRAGLDPVIPGTRPDRALVFRRPLDASYREETAVDPRRGARYLVGALLVLAAVSFVAVTLQAFSARKKLVAENVVKPLAPLTHDAAPSVHSEELADPDAPVVMWTNPAPNGAPKQNSAPPPTAHARPEDHVQESIAPPQETLDVNLPSWWSGALQTEPIATAKNESERVERAASAERAERLARFLMVRGRSSAPLADISAGFPAAAANDETLPPAAAPTDGQEKSLPQGIWDGNTVPMDQIGAGARILTPHVGRVRVAVQGGSAIEGRLYAVGQKKVWVDTDAGRTALESARIEKLEQIAAPPAPESDDKTAPRAGAVSAERVRVKTPGGLFYGKIVARDERTVTLVTDEGTRVTLESTDIVSAPASRTVVKHDAARPAKKPATPKTEPRDATPSPY